MIQVERRDDSVKLSNDDSYSLIVRRDEGGKWTVAKGHTPTGAIHIMFTPEKLGEFGSARDAVFFAKHYLGEWDPDELDNALRDAGLLG